MLSGAVAVSSPDRGAPRPSPAERESWIEPAGGGDGWADGADFCHRCVAGRGHAGQIGVGAMAKDRRADSTAFLNAPALKELMGGAREASEEESLATREWALRDEPATREREAAEARNGHRHGAPSAEAAAPAAPASAPAEEQREPCGKILEPFSTAQEGMNKWKATMECPDAQKGVVAPDGAVVVRLRDDLLRPGGARLARATRATRPPPAHVQVPGDCPEALVSPAIKIHRPSAGWLPQPHHKSPTEIWEVICSEAKLESEREPALASGTARASTSSAALLVCAHQAFAPSIPPGLLPVRVHPVAQEPRAVDGLRARQQGRQPHPPERPPPQAL